jgi:hypothetical protein
VSPMGRIVSNKPNWPWTGRAAGAAGRTYCDKQTQFAAGGSVKLLVPSMGCIVPNKPKWVARQGPRGLISQNEPNLEVPSASNKANFLNPTHEGKYFKEMEL